MAGLSFADTSNPWIDIGLKFGNNNTYPIGISSNSGFQFGYLDHDEFQTVLDLSEYSGLIVHKLGFYDHLSTLNASPSFEPYSKGYIKGAYTLTLASFGDDLASALSLYQANQYVSPNVYLSYDGGWSIAYGNYITEAEAQADLEATKALFSSSEVVVKKQVSTMVIIYGNQVPLVAYDTADDRFQIKTDVFEYNDKKYRNSLVVRRLPDSDFSIVNRLYMNEYLYGVLPKEMSGDWPIEALKAQAIAARNFALVNRGKHADQGFDLCTTTDCQVYGGYNVEKANSNLAVDETLGEYLVYDGDLVSCYYHSNSGGQTEDIENIWSGSLPYIKGVSDPYSIGQPNTDWTLHLTAAQIEKTLSSAGYVIGTYQGARIDQFSDNGRVTKITFLGSNGQATLLKEEMRKYFGYTTLKSMYFSFGEKPVDSHVSVMASDGMVSMNQDNLAVISSEGVSDLTDTPYWFDGRTLYTPQNQSSVERETVSNGPLLTLYGHGYGHGLGMSQWGAKAMAEAGFDYKSILTHYYQGTQIVNHYE